MHARRPFAASSSAEEEAELASSAAATAAIILDEEEQDHVVDELSREAAVAIGWTQAGLGLSLLAITLLYILTSPVKSFLFWLVTVNLLGAGLSILPTNRPPIVTFWLARLPPVFGGLLPSLYALATGTFTARRLLAPDLGFALAFAGRLWIDGLERDLRLLERGKYKLKGA